MQISAHGWQEVGALKAAQGVQHQSSDVVTRGSNREHEGPMCSHATAQLLHSMHASLHNTPRPKPSYFWRCFEGVSCS